jgi:hypothetical protein
VLLSKSYIGISENTMNLEFRIQGPDSWDSTCKVHPFAPICPIKRHGEGQTKEIYYPAWEEMLNLSSSIFRVDKELGA